MYAQFKMKRTEPQLALVLKERCSWGGARKGAGRKRAEHGSAPHRRRPEHKRYHPVHATLRVVRGLPSLRKKPQFAVIKDVFRHAAVRDGFRIVHYSVQTDHLRDLALPS